MSTSCSVCTADNREELEDLGLRAQVGELSWLGAAKTGGLTHGQGLKNHMLKHVVAQVEREHDKLEDELSQEVLETKRMLLEQMRTAPAEVRALMLVALRNLDGLLDTKPSQQHLINALKSVHEITGMRIEQKLMLQFGAAAFGAAPERVEITRGDEKRALEAGFSPPIDVEEAVSA